MDCGIVGLFGFSHVRCTSLPWSDSGWKFIHVCFILNLNHLVCFEPFSPFLAQCFIDGSLRAKRSPSSLIAGSMHSECGFICASFAAYNAFHKQSIFVVLCESRGTAISYVFSLQFCTLKLPSISSLAITSHIQIYRSFNTYQLLPA